MAPSVSIGGRDTAVRQVQWRTTVQTPVNYHSQLEEHPIGDVKPVKLVVQYLTQTAVKLPSTGDDACSRVQHTLQLVRDCPWCTGKNSVEVIDP